MPTPPEGWPADPEPTAWTPEEIEVVLRHALGKGDIDGVDACLRLLATRDPERAALLVETMRVGIAIARERDLTAASQPET